MNKIALILAGLTLGFSIPATADAQPQQGRYAQRGAQERQDGPRPQRQDDRPAAAPMRLVSLNQVISQIQRSTPGRLLDASPPEPGSARPTYRIRWQADSGQRIDFIVDAQSGAIVGRNGG